MPQSQTKTKNRLETLDHLRGFFIVVIIIDHLSRFPSLFTFVSGKGLLWVTAAEGFVAISGLLVGYVRGYKNRHLPFADVAVKLLQRAGLLYIWSLIASIVYVAIIWYIPLKGGFPGTPMAVGDWSTFLIQLVTMQYTFVWVHFLTLYALFLAAAPIAIWLLRRNLAWAVAIISLGLLALGWKTDIEALQWQILFFLPAIAGFYLQPILDWWHGRKRSTQIVIAASTVTLTLATIAASIAATYYGASLSQVATYLNTTLFAKDSMSLIRIGFAFLWFTGYIFIFYKLRHVIDKAFGWLLLPFGTRSLTAYIVHGIALCTVSFFTVGGDNIWINSILGVCALLITWGLLRLAFIRRIIPA
jgi:hypothetical protein